MFVSDYDVVKAMMRYGGGFVSKLGAAWQCADSVNQAKLRAVFPAYWKQYAELAQLKAQEDAHAKPAKA